MATTWIHNRKGRITGEIVRQDQTWMWVRIDGDHTLRYGSESNQGRIDGDGEILCVRTEYMRELDDREKRNPIVAEDNDGHDDACRDGGFTSVANP